MAMTGSDITVAGRRTTNHGVRVGSEEPRSWLVDYAVCPALKRYQMLHAGWFSAFRPYRIVRTRQTTRYFLASYGGEGRVLVDGRWRVVRAGMACLLPPHVRNEFYAVGDKPWQFCYVCYAVPSAEPQLASSPILARYRPEPLRHAIAGLEAECRGDAVPADVHHWLELIQSCVLRFARPSRNEPLQELWAHVATNLGARWTLGGLARQAHCSKEHLRRLCLRHLGRSPMHHLTYLRLQRAAELLASGGPKVEQVAEAVGYRNSFAFSTTFKKWIGWTPSDYRGRR